MEGGRLEKRQIVSPIIWMYHCKTVKLFGLVALDVCDN